MRHVEKLEGMALDGRRRRDERKAVESGVHRFDPVGGNRREVGEEALEAVDRQTVRRPLRRSLR